MGTLWCVYVGKEGNRGAGQQQEKPQAGGSCGFSEGALAIRDTGPGPEDKTQNVRTPRAQGLTTRQVSQHLGKAFPSTPRSQGPGGVNRGEK